MGEPFPKIDFRSNKEQRCAGCGKELKRQGHAFCSLKCRDKYKASSMVGNSDLEELMRQWRMQRWTDVD